MQAPHLIILIFALLVCRDTAAQSKDSQGKTPPAAIVNGTPIPQSELAQHIQAREAVLRERFAKEPEQMEKGIQDVKRTALDALIDEQLLVDEFDRQGGVLSAAHVEEDLTAIIKSGFGGSREALLAELAKSGMTLDDFRAKRERLIKIAVMRSRLGGEPSVTAEMLAALYERDKQRWGSAETSFESVKDDVKKALEKELKESTLKTQMERLRAGAKIQKPESATGTKVHGER